MVESYVVLFLQCILGIEDVVALSLLKELPIYQFFYNGSHRLYKLGLQASSIVAIQMLAGAYHFTEIEVFATPCYSDREFH